MGISIYTHNSSCGKVLFSQACVIPSVHWGRGACGGGAFMAGECVVGGVHGRASVPKVCMTGGIDGRGVCGGGHVW